MIVSHEARPPRALEYDSMAEHAAVSNQQIGAKPELAA